MFLCWTPHAVQTVIIVAFEGREWAMKSMTHPDISGCFSVPWYWLPLMCKMCSCQTLDPLNFRFSRSILVCYKSLTPSVISSFDFQPVNKSITWFWNFRNNSADMLKTGFLKVAVADDWKVQQGSFGILGSSSWAILWLWYIFYYPEQWNGKKHKKSDNTGSPELLYRVFSWHCNFN